MRNKCVLFMIALAIISAPMIAQDVPLELQTKLMLKIVSMDRNFDRFGNPIKIGTSSDEIFKELSTIKGSLKVKGNDFLVEKINSPADIAKFKVAYIGKNWSGNYNAAAAAAAANQCLMFCEVEEGVTTGGGAVSFKVVEGKPKIVINLENAKKQGTDFPAGFLKITVVVGGL